MWNGSRTRFIRCTSDRMIEEHIAKGGRLNLDNWREIEPEYGSEAYQALDKTGYFFCLWRKNT